jgi:hypothetical protein
MKDNGDTNWESGGDRRFTVVRDPTTHSNRKTERQKDRNKDESLEIVAELRAIAPEPWRKAPFFSTTFFSTKAGKVRLWTAI